MKKGAIHSESESENQKPLVLDRPCGRGPDGHRRGPQTFTSWPAVWDGILAVLRNPVQLVTGILAVLAVFIDPTTAGIKDSARAMTYKAPAKDKEAK